MRHPSRWRNLREPAEERESHRPSFAAGETRRQDLLAIPILLVPPGRTFPAQHLQQILGFVFLQTASVTFDLERVFLQLHLLAITWFHWLTRSLICHRPRRSYRNTTTSTPNSSATAITDPPTAVPIACAHTKSIFRWMPSSKSFWSMKYNNPI